MSEELDPLALEAIDHSTKLARKIVDTMIEYLKEVDPLILEEHLNKVYISALSIAFGMSCRLMAKAQKLDHEEEMQSVVMYADAFRNTVVKSYTELLKTYTN